MSYSGTIDLDAGPSELLSLRAGIAQSRPNALLDRRALKLSHGADDLEHQRAQGCAQIEVIAEAGRLRAFVGGPDGSRGQFTSPQLSAWLMAAMLVMVTLPAAITLHTVRAPGRLVVESANPSSHGYTWSPLLFIAPIVVIALWFLPRARVVDDCDPNSAGLGGWTSSPHPAVPWWLTFLVSRRENWRSVSSVLFEDALSPSLRLRAAVPRDAICSEVTSPLRVS